MSGLNGLRALVGYYLFMISQNIGELDGGETILAKGLKQLDAKRLLTSSMSSHLNSIGMSILPFAFCKQSMSQSIRLVAFVTI